MAVRLPVAPFVSAEAAAAFAAKVATVPSKGVLLTAEPVPRRTPFTWNPPGEWPEPTARQIREREIARANTSQDDDADCLYDGDRAMGDSR